MIERAMPQRRFPVVLQGAGGALGLVVVVVGVPWALVTLAGWPLPRSLPRLGEVSAVLSSRAELPATTVFKAVALLGWLAWAEVALAVGREVVAQVRHRSAAPWRLPLGGAAQAMAGRLVASALLLAGPFPSRSGITPAPRPLAAVTAVALAPAPPESDPTPAPGDLPPGTKAYEVRPGDYLSRIAQDHLGAARRFPEISALNWGRVQPDGEALIDDDLIQPQWRLAMPADATGVAVMAEAPVPPAPIPEAPATTELEPDASPDAPSTLPMTPGGERMPERPDGESPRSSVPPARPGDEGDQSVPSNPAPALAFAAPALLAGLTVSHMARLRANQQRHRRRGRDITRPPVALQEAEIRVRAVADEEAAAWVDGAVRLLWPALEKAEMAEVPRITCVRAGALGVELLLDRDVPAPNGLVCADGGRVWRLDPTIDLPHLRQLAEEHSPALPALLSVGQTPEGPLLVDLECAGTLAVEGDPRRVAAFLRGAAVELASAPWAEDVPLILVGGDPALAPLERVELASAEEVVARFVSGEPASPEPSSRLGVRVAPPACEALPPTAVIFAPGAAAETLDSLVGVAPADSGLVVVGPGPILGANLALRIEADGAARLEPLGIELTCAIDEEAVDAIGALLAQAAEVNDAPLVVEEPDPQPDEDKPERWVRVLGPVEIDWANEAPRSRSAELVAYLATSDRPVPAERLKVHLWPDPKEGEVASSTFRSTVSRARAALGKDARGEDHLPDAQGGCYHLGPGVGSDWQRFRRLVARARRSSSSEALERYRAALALVRGAPFADSAKGTYAWAHAGPVWEIETAVAEAAERMAELALDAGESKLADWAARRGLLVCPDREILYQLRMRAAAAQDDPEGIEQAWRQVRHALRTGIGPLEEPREDTVRLYQTLIEQSSERLDATVGPSPLNGNRNAPPSA